jgi:hypothetical protein
LPRGHHALPQVIQHCDEEGAAPPGRRAASLTARAPDVTYGAPT